MLRAGIVGPVAHATASFKQMTLKEGTTIEQIFEWLRPMIYAVQEARLIAEHRAQDDG